MYNKKNGIIKYLNIFIIELLPDIFVDIFPGPALRNRTGGLKNMAFKIFSNIMRPVRQMFAETN
jgi:hypothetical protein